MNILLHIYFGINLLLAGGVPAEKRGQPVYKMWLWILLCMLFGCFMILWAFIQPIVTPLWNKIEVSLQITFWWRYYFGDGFKNINLEQLETMEADVKRRFNTNSFKHKMLRRCVKLIQERNKQ